MTTLMERTSGGWHVELRLTDAGSPAILLQRGEDAEHEGTLVPPEKALDAFWHPVCYLPQVKSFAETLPPLAERLEAYSVRV